MDRLMLELALSLVVIAVSIGMIVHLCRYAYKKIKAADQSAPSKDARSV